MQADYIIIGAGSAGCVLATRLSENPCHQVVLIEAGGHDARPSVQIPGGFVSTMVNPAVNWMFETAPIAGLCGRSMAMPRGRILGGTSSINGMLYVRGQKEDYDDWAAAGNEGWAYDDVLPYFIKSENASALMAQANESGQHFDTDCHGTDGPVHVSALPLGRTILDDVIVAAQQCGYQRNDDYNGHCQSGFGYFQVTQKRGQRHSAYRAFVHPVRARKNLHILTRAQALCLLFDTGDKRRATGVRIRHKGRTRDIFAGREVVLSAGAFGSPQLLELSGVGRAGELKGLGIRPLHNLPGVGENLRDHYLARLTWQLKFEHSLNHTSRGLALLKEGLRYLLTRRGSLSLTAGILAGFVSSRPAAVRPDIQFHIAHASFANPARRIFDRFPGLTIGPCQLRPESRGYVHIASADPLAAPHIQPNYLAAETDRLTLLAGLRVARHIMAAPALDGLLEAERRPGSDIDDDEGLLAFARETGNTVYHPACSCMMGPDPASGAVVDNQLRVHGLRGLRIADASVMPMLVSGNTHAPTMMIAEKAAALISMAARD